MAIQFCVAARIDTAAAVDTVARVLASAQRHLLESRRQAAQREELRLRVQRARGQR